MNQRRIVIILCVLVVIALFTRLSSSSSKKKKHNNEYFGVCPFLPKEPDNNCESTCSKLGGITTSFSSPDLVDQRDCICIPESDINCTFDVVKLPNPGETIVDIKYSDQNFLDLNMSRNWTQETLDDYFFNLATSSTAPNVKNSFTDLIAGTRGYSPTSTNINTGTLNECMQACENNKGCKSFYFDGVNSCFQFPNEYSLNLVTPNSKNSKETIRDQNGRPGSMTGNKKLNSGTDIPDTSAFTDLKATWKGYIPSFVGDANATSASNCMQSCATDDACKSFYYSDENGCLKSPEFYFEGTTTRDANGTTSSLTGNKRGNTNIPGYIHVSETSVSNNKYVKGNIPNVDLDTCRLECDVLSDCKAFFYNEGQHNCTLFNQNFNSEFNRDDNNISGIAAVKQMMPPNLGNYRNISVGRVISNSKNNNSIIMNQNIANATECAQICDNNDACTAFYSGGDGSCASYINSTVDQIGITDDGDLFGVYADKNVNNFNNYLFNFSSDGTCQNFVVADSNVNNQAQSSVSKGCFNANNTFK